MRRLLPLLMLLLLLPLSAGLAFEEEEPEEDQPIFSAGTFAGLALRNIGPALMSGRVVDIVIDPTRRATWYVAVACGGVWKTDNRGTTWKPIFDGEGSYSIGCLALDPGNSKVLWVGTGENNSQRSVGYGDGIYLSRDGGKSFKKMGLEASEHIGKILVDPRDSNTVYVAAQGPLWAPGGDRGLYKTVDGGVTWEKVLEISENTGVSDLVFEAGNPDVIYASSYQRRRHVFTLINGGPESAIYQSTDAGATWNKLEKGLPKGEVGRIGLAVSPMDPDVVYALIEGSDDKKGFYRSADRGASWSKKSSYDTVSAQYYQEIFADPHQFDRVYSVDTITRVTEDGGKTFQAVGRKNKHVDDHALVFDPDDPDYLLIGCDGGIYESYDRAKTWAFKANLPITQFYKLCVDYAEPFYNIYGGTQDNNTQGGPSRTLSYHGIRNSDWFITKGGDGFKPQVDPTDPNIVYSQSQYGVLSRMDRKNFERVSIQPQPGPDDEPLRWNWDSPLIISPHDPDRLYFAANILFRSDNQGSGWQPVSGDLTRCIDRNQLEVMDKVWHVDAVAKNDSTSCYGNIVSLAESPLAEGLLYAGTDDGLIQVTEDGGETWRSLDSFSDIPEFSYVADIEASLHNADRVYALFNNHKYGDFKPYILKSDDRGLTWSNVTGDLPERGSVWALAEDHEKETLLFVGTEFGVYFTLDQGDQWLRLKGGIPTIAVRDLEIQRRENDLVCASFGRSFYILDDYTPLRTVTPELLEEPATLFPIKPALQYVQARDLGWSEKGSQGAAYFTAANPPYGAIFTYYLKEPLKTKKKIRREAEKELEKEGDPMTYPTWEALQEEEWEEKPAIVFTVMDAEGAVVRRLTGPKGKGFHRVAWNLRYPAYTPASQGREEGAGPSGPMVVPGPYQVKMEQRLDGVLTPLGAPQTFTVLAFGESSFPAADRAELLAFQQKVGRLQRAVLGASRSLAEIQKAFEYIKTALDDTPGADPALGNRTRALITRLKEIKVRLNGDQTRARRNAPVLPSIVERTQQIAGAFGSATTAPTDTQQQGYEIAATQFTRVLEELRSIREKDLKAIEDALESACAPYTPGRLPRWIKE